MIIDCNNFISKEMLRRAIVDKGVEVPEETLFSDYADKVAAIPSGGTARTLAPQRIQFSSADIQNSTIDLTTGLDWSKYSADSLPYMFAYNPELRILDIGPILNAFTAERNETPNLSYMFYGNTGIVSVSFNYDQPSTLPYNTNLSGMFQGCMNLSSVGIMKFKKIYNASSMFRGTGIYNVDFSNCTIAGSSNWSNAFQDCSRLSMVKIPYSAALGTQYLGSISKAFYNCTNLHYLDISAWNIENYTGSSDCLTGVPNNCHIVVMNEACKTKLQSWYPDLTDINVM